MALLHRLNLNLNLHRHSRPWPHRSWRAWQGLACRRLSWWLLAAASSFAPAAAAQAPPLAAAQRAPAERSLGDWLARMEHAARRHNYAGTFVVSARDGALSSARLWHACDGERQIDKLEALTGVPRSSVRRDDETLTLLPEQRLARLERREGQGRFTAFLPAAGVAAIADVYTARFAGVDRVAGFDTEVVVIAPRDTHRRGYRIWSEKRTGLVVKLQTLGADGEVLEQVAFSQLQLDAPLRIERLAQAMVPPAGWQVERIEAVRTSADQEGWWLKTPVAGFTAVGLYRRRAGGVEGPLQWVFSDGLASVSLFIEPYDRLRHGQEGLLGAGATQTFTRRWRQWWITAVGEVPPQTLKVLSQGLDRQP